VRELEISGSSGNDDMKSFSLAIHLAAVLSTLLLAYVVLFKLLMILARMLLRTNRQTIARLRATSTLKAEDTNDRRRHRRSRRRRLSRGLPRHKQSEWRHGSMITFTKRFQGSSRGEVAFELLLLPGVYDEKERREPVTTTRKTAVGVPV